nr:endonuclease/exonuclease/phosphatase family protein [Streptomyces sp. RPA4-2]
MVDGRPVPPAAADEPAEPLSRAVMSLDADVLALQEVDRFQERSGRVDQAGAAARRRAWTSGATRRRCTPVPPGTGVGPRPDGAGAAHVRPPGHRDGRRCPLARTRAAHPPPGPGLADQAAGPGAARHAPARARPARPHPGPGPAARGAGRRTGGTAGAVHRRGGAPDVRAGMERPPVAHRPRLDRLSLPLPHVLLGDFNLVGAVPRAVLNAPRTTRSTPPRRWRDTARTPTYPAHRPVVQFDHVLTAGIGAEAVGTAGTVRTAISDHRPLVVELSL